MPVSTHHTTGKSSKVQAALWDMTLTPLKLGECGFKLTFIECEWHITDTHNKTGLTSNGMRVGVKLLQLWGGAIQSCLQLLQLWGSCSYSEKTLENDEFKDGFRAKAKTQLHPLKCLGCVNVNVLFCWIAAAAVLERSRYNVDTVKGWTILVLWFSVIEPQYLYCGSITENICRSALKGLEKITVADQQFDIWCLVQTL